MLEVYMFTVFGKPTSWQRSGQASDGHRFTPDETRSYEAKVQGCFRNENPEAVPFRGPVAVYINAFFQIPSSWSKKKKALAEDGLVYPSAKKDCDNIAKAICDALNGLAYLDDRQVMTLNVNKRCTSDGDRVTVQIVELSDWSE